MKITHRRRRLLKEDIISYIVNVGRIESGTEKRNE